MSGKLGKHIVLDVKTENVNENLFVDVLHHGLARAMDGRMGGQAGCSLKDELINLIACGKWD